MKLFDKLKNRKAKERREKVAELVRSAKGWEAECAILKERAETFKYGYDTEKEATARLTVENSKLREKVAKLKSGWDESIELNNNRTIEVEKLKAERDEVRESAECWKETAGIEAAFVEDGIQEVKKLQAVFDAARVVIEHPQPKQLKLLRIAVCTAAIGKEE